MKFNFKFPLDKYGYLDIQELTDVWSEFQFEILTQVIHEFLQCHKGMQITDKNLKEVLYELSCYFSRLYREFSIVEGPFGFEFSREYVEDYYHSRQKKQQMNQNIKRYQPELARDYYGSYSIQIAESEHGEYILHDDVKDLLSAMESYYNYGDRVAEHNLFECYKKLTGKTE